MTAAGGPLELALSSSGRTVLRGARVFDGTSEELSSAEIAVEGSRIVDVGHGLEGDAEVDLDGLTVLPGLIDCHVHALVSGFDPLMLLDEPFSYQFYAATRNLKATLDCGVTTIRDAGGADLGVKKALADGLLEGPEVLAAITVIGQTGGHTDGWNPSGRMMDLLLPHPGRPPMVVDGPDEMRKRVREIVRAGADVIKVCTTGGVLSPRDDPRHSQFSAEELAICVQEAAAAGLPVMAHAQGAEGIKNAVRAGVRSIEHGIYLDDEGIELMRDRGTWLVPTLSAPTSLIRLGDGGVDMPPAVLEKARSVIEIHAEAVGRAASAGVRIAMGTDSGVFPHGDNLDELALMVDAGVSPVGALVSATSSAAELLGIGDRVGRIAPGYQADLAIVSGDALDFTGYRSRVVHVVKEGRLVVPTDHGTGG